MGGLMLLLACGTPMYQYFWHLMKKPQKVNFLTVFIIIYFKFYIMVNVILLWFLEFLCLFKMKLFRF